MYETPPTRYEQENLRNMVHFETFNRVLDFCIYSLFMLDNKDTARRSYRPVHTFKKTHNSARLSSFKTAYVGIK
jgi:hypothetical protein